MLKCCEKDFERTLTTTFNYSLFAVHNGLPDTEAPQSTYYSKRISKIVKTLHSHIQNRHLNQNSDQQHINKTHFHHYKSWRNRNAAINNFLPRQRSVPVPCYCHNQQIIKVNQRIIDQLWFCRRSRWAELERVRRGSTHQLQSVYLQCTLDCLSCPRSFSFAGRLFLDIAGRVNCLIHSDKMQGTVDQYGLCIVFCLWAGGVGRLGVWGEAIQRVIFVDE